MDAPPIQYVKTSDGYDLAYAVAGSGRPLLFIPPPFTSVQTVWFNHDEWMEGLSQRFRVFAFDRRGMGLSTRGLPEDFSVDSFLLDLRAVADLLGGEPCLLFAFGNPGHTAVRFAVRSPDVVEGIIWDVANVSPSAYPSGMWQTLPNENWHAFLSSIVPPGVSIEERQRLIQEYDEWTTLADWNTVSGSNRGSSVEDELPKLRAPLLVLHVEGFPMFPPEESRKVAAAVRGARFVLLKHVGQFLGDPVQGLAAIDSFIADLPPASERLVTSPIAESTDSLSAREVEVLRLLSQGKSNPEIAKELFITRNTVQNHVSSILIKLNLQNRAQAAVYAKEHGLV